MRKGQTRFRGDGTDGICLRFEEADDPGDARIFRAARMSRGRTLLAARSCGFTRRRPECGGVAGTWGETREGVNSPAVWPATRKGVSKTGAQRVHRIRPVVVSELHERGRPVASAGKVQRAEREVVHRNIRCRRRRPRPAACVNEVARFRVRCRACAARRAGARRGNGVGREARDSIKFAGCNRDPKLHGRAPAASSARSTTH